MLYKSFVFLYKSSKIVAWVSYVAVSSTATTMAWIFSTLFRYSVYGSTASGIHSKETGLLRVYFNEALCWVLVSLAFHRFTFQLV